MYLPFAETETLTMKLMKRRILQVCLTCHWASEKIVIGRRNNMLVRINFYFFLPNSSLNVMIPEQVLVQQQDRELQTLPSPSHSYPLDSNGGYYSDHTTDNLESCDSRRDSHDSNSTSASASLKPKREGKDEKLARTKGITVYISVYDIINLPMGKEIFSFLLQIYNLIFIIQRSSQRLWTDTSWKEWPRSRSPLQKTSGKNQTLLSYIVNSNVPLSADDEVKTRMLPRTVGSVQMTALTHWKLVRNCCVDMCRYV